MNIMYVQLFHDRIWWESDQSFQTVGKESTFFSIKDKLGN